MPYLPHCGSLERTQENRSSVPKTYPEAYVAYVAQTLNNLAVLYDATHRFDQAEEYYLRALEIRERLAKAHPEVHGQDYAGCLQNASYISLLVQKFAQAEEYSLEALKWSDNVGIYTNLAAAILLQGRFEDAKEIYLRYKDEKKESFLSDFQTLKDNNAIPEHLIGDVEKIIELLNS